MSAPTAIKALKTYASVLSDLHIQFVSSLFDNSVLSKREFQKLDQKLSFVLIN